MKPISFMATLYALVAFMILAGICMLLGVGGNGFLAGLVGLVLVLQFDARLKE